MKKLLLALTMVTAMSTSAFAQGQVKNVYASTQKLNVEQLQNTEKATQLNRYLFAGYNTLCVPMSLTAEQLGDVKVERFAGIRQEGNVLNLYFVECTSEGIQAGVPYLVYSPKAQYLRMKNSEALRVNSELKAVRMNDGKGNTVTFSSNWETVKKDGLYGIPAQQNVTPLESVLIRTQADKAFLPTRCGFSWDEQASSASELCIVHATQAELTAIKNVSVQNTSGNAYDLSGRKVTTAKGLRIQDGKKVLK
jgi:phosphopantothenoylcysteine synthetase/decarboxylase